MIGYYSKTLVDSQKNYPIFDKEAGAILVCVRHWSDLIAYHPTTIYTDSSVAASMLTKHAAPPRLQRWGMELGAYLPQLRIAFRRGTDNGLADLLSRFSAFEKFTTTRDENLELPDDLFDRIGEAPLFNPSARKEQRVPYMDSSVYELYEAKLRKSIASPLWCSPDAPEIPERSAGDHHSIIELSMQTISLVCSIWRVGAGATPAAAPIGACERVPPHCSHAAANARHSLFMPDHA